MAANDRSETDISLRPYSCMFCTKVAHGCSLILHSGLSATLVHPQHATRSSINCRSFVDNLFHANAVRDVSYYIKKNHTLDKTSCCWMIV